MKIKIQAILISLGLMSCEDLAIPNANQFVVEGFITADSPVDNIKIKKTINLNEDIQDIPISNAIVKINNGSSEFSLTYNSSTKKYFDPSGSAVIHVGDEFNIEIEVDGTVATSSTVVPEKPIDLNLSKTELVVPQLVLNIFLRDQIVALFNDEISNFTWKGIPGRFYFVVIETQEKTLNPIIPAGVPEQSKELLKSFKFISAPSEATSFVIRAVALETYGKYVAKVYSVNKEYVDLFNSAEQDSRDLNAPPSNIKNGLGIFSAFAVDSLEFTVVQ